MPFVQGHLRNESLAVTIGTQCVHCSRSMKIEIDSEVSFKVIEGEAPLIFIPLVNFKKLEDPSIIDAF